jgi:alkanesulfonate monooxygenase SsuD/methylene tetrahydromethanopterin reductase-like flavin-dependent oxidoreductase (luciferase family)
MSGLRLSLAVPGATSAELLELGALADFWNIAGLWVGDPRGAADNRSDSYVTATAAALAARTTDIRLGLFLALGREKQLVRIAEDIAVVDQASGGRVELAFVPPAQEREAWTKDVARLLRAWNAWEIPSSDEVVPVIPGPAQPTVPRLIVDDRAAADALGAGRMIFRGEPDADALVPRRTVLVVEPGFAKDGVFDWLAGGAVERVTDLRDRARAAGAQELLFVVPGLTEADVKALGTAVVPGLRAADRDVRHIVSDGWTWLTDKAHLHAPAS